MALTQIDVNVLKGPQNSETLLVESRIKFDQQCVIDQHSVTDLYNIFWITKGNATIRIDFNKFDVVENTLFFLVPGQVFTVLSEERLEGHRLAFEGDFYFLSTVHPQIGSNGLLFHHFNFNPLIHIDNRDALEFGEILRNLESSLEHDIIARSEMLQSYLKIFLIKCAQIKKQQIVEASELEEESLTSLSHLNNLIEKNFKVWHGVAEYADALHLSPKSLTKKLANYGQKPSQLIQDRIILESKRMLFYSGKTSKEVAYELGFEDPSHFSRFFKKKTGLSPGEFVEKSEM